MTKPDEESSITVGATPAPTGPTYVEPLARGGEDLSGVFGRYQIVRRLGKGGMGRVYLAHDTALDRRVALKVPHLEAGDPSALRERFLREARAAANLHHPNICPIFEAGSIGELPYLTMAYIDGQALHEWAAAGRPLPALLSAVRGIALALDEAHRQGVVHRDLKPSNVLIDRRGEPVVLDFGLARRLFLEDRDRLTRPGLIVGTPGYMAPEQADGGDSSGPPCDVYSLGVILYELLTGRLPFEGATTMAILARMASETPRPPSEHRPGLSPHLDAVCLRALARDPASRYPSMAELAAALSTPAAEPATPARRPAATAEVQTPPTMMRLPPPDLAQRFLDQARKLGWARAMQKTRGRAQGADSERERNAVQGFMDWLGEGALSPHFPYAEIPHGRALRGWALAGQASRVLRDRGYHDSLRLLDRARAEGDPDDQPLAATIAHTHGAALVHLGQCDEALPYLSQALEKFGREHFMTGRVLDTLGTAYATKGNFPIAREFYQQSLRFKERCDDEAGVALSHGQLGRLYLDWGHLDEAEEHFQEDLALAQRLRSRFSEAQIYNHLGQVSLARAEGELSAGRRAPARRHLDDADGWLDQSVRTAMDGKHAVAEGFARKDRALLHLLRGDLDAAGDEARQAQALFTAAQFGEGSAKVALVEAMVLRERQQWAEAEQKLRQAVSHFERVSEGDDAVRAWWERARIERDRRAPAALVSRAYMQALARAETLRHDPLVKGIEREFHDVDPEAYLRHIYRRARGYMIDEDDPSLMEGVTESATILFLDLPGFSEFASGLDPQAVLVTFNHLMGDFADVLARHGGRVAAYRGNGLMAIFRDSRHPERAVFAALDLVAALKSFNAPREMLGLPLFHARVGIASGDVLLGNVGTYHKMDFTAIGPAVSIAGALRNEARYGLPCISRATYEAARGRFRCEADEPRAVAVAGYGAVDVWDVREKR